MDDQDLAADIAAANLPKFEQELAALRLELDRLIYLRNQEDCPGEAKPALEERIKQVRTQIWTAERSLEFLRARQPG